MNNGLSDLHDPDWSRLLPWLARLPRDRQHRLSEASTAVLGGFVGDLYDAHAVYSFDWPAWQAEAENLYNDSEALQAASLADLRKLLTTHVRKDRYCEGHLEVMLKTGHLRAILEQVARHLAGRGLKPDTDR